MTKTTNLQLGVSILSTLQVMYSFSSLLHDMDATEAERLNNKLQTLFLTALGITAAYKTLTRPQFGEAYRKESQLDKSTTETIRKLTHDNRIEVRQAPEAHRAKMMRAGDKTYCFVMNGLPKTIFIVPENMKTLSDSNVAVGMMLHEYQHLKAGHGSSWQTFLSKFLPSLLSTLGKGLLTSLGIRALRDYTEDMEPKERNRLFMLIVFGLFAYAVAEILVIMYMKKREEYQANKRIPEPYRSALADFFQSRVVIQQRRREGDLVDRSTLIKILKTCLYRAKQILKEYPSEEQHLKSLISQVKKHNK